MNIKKVALTLASVAAITTFAPEASAIPAFARQVGMACSACHYQHFPVLNAFGRAFKQGAYTMVGTQEKIEGEGLSLPATENLAIVGYVAYSKTNGAPSAANTTTGTTDYGNLNGGALATHSNDGNLQIPQQVSLFAGGRGGENFGFEAEINLNGVAGGNGGGTGAGNAGLIRFKVPFVVEAGGLKNQIIPFSTANGVADSFEVLNTGAVNVHAFNQTDMAAVSAQQYIGTGGFNASGFALVTSNENFFANVSKWGATAGDGTSGGGALGSNYVRAAWTGDLGGFDSAIGFQYWGGSSVSDSVAYATATPWGVYNTQAFAIDAQVMGDVGGMPLLVVASYAKAPTTSATGGTLNLYNQQNLDMSSFNIGAELGIVQNVATVQLAYRHAMSGQDVGTITGGTATGQNASDNAVMLGLTYAVALNARLEFTQSWYSGDIYASNSTAATAGNSLTAFDLAFAF